VSRTTRVLFAVLAVLALSALLGLTSGITPSALGQEEEAYPAPKFEPYIGVVKCRMCHRDRHATWLEDDPHSKAFSSLTPEDVTSGRKDEKGQLCVSCHVTGYGEPGGFVSFEKTPGMADVGCEACHGPGRDHVLKILKSVMDDTGNTDKLAAEGKAAIQRSGDCSKCHDPHYSYKKHYGKKDADEDEDD
jgi:hypothetical protein